MLDFQRRRHLKVSAIAAICAQRQRWARDGTKVFPW
jgi:hypothetical protein